MTVNTLLPGRIDTPRIQSLDKSAAERTGVTPAEARAESVKSIPVGRIGTTEEFGATAAFLASPLAAYVGDTSLLQSLWSVVSARGLVVHVHVLPLQAATHADRRALAALLQDQIEAAVAP